MRIANPIYDKTFKYLMENEKIAKKVISVFLDKEVKYLKLNQQEAVVPSNKLGLTLYRLDFTAIIVEKNGEEKKVLIELQKSKFSTNIQRFRTYLGANYIKKDEAKIINNKEVYGTYPIITIYILGYNLKDLPYMSVSVNRQIINTSTKEAVDVDSFFINQLTHESLIIQVKRLPAERKTRLEKFLTLFNQAWVAEKNYILDLEKVPKEFEEMVKHLSKPILDEEFRILLEGEEEIDKIFDDQESAFLEKMERIQKREKEAIKREKEAQEQIKKQNKIIEELRSKQIKS